MKKLVITEKGFSFEGSQLELVSLICAFLHELYINEDLTKDMLKDMFELVTLSDKELHAKTKEAVDAMGSELKDLREQLKELLEEI